MESALPDGAGASGLRLATLDPDLRLIETMLWDGAGFPRLALHQARLARSAAALGWAAPAALAPVGLPGHPLRVRVTLDRHGAFSVETAALPAARPLWTVGLSKARLASADPWLRIKSTRRVVYDLARAALPAGLDEVIFANERDEICEGTITTLFFDRGQGMRTPPVSCGLLPGVLRAELAVAEEVLRVEDLPHVRLWVGNALRGLIAARLIA